MRRTALVVLALLAACRGGEAGTATGVVVEVEGNLEQVTSFTVVAEDGERLRFLPHPAGVDAPFPLPHLRDHLRSGEPVRVEWVRSEEGELLATSVDDA